MAKVQLTKSHIVNTFKTMAIEQPLRHIHVRDVIEACDINRTTFYYHFLDKQDLVVWIFRSEFAQIVAKEFPGQKLVCDTEIQGERYRDLPFYLDTRSSEYNLELGPFWLALGIYLADQFDYYNHVLCTEESNSLSQYLHRIYYVQLQKDVRYASGEKRIPEDVIKFLAVYFTNACVGYLVNGIMHNSPYPYVWNAESPELQGFINISHDLIKHIISRIG